jgi:hypothetical protein
MADYFFQLPDWASAYSEQAPVPRGVDRLWLRSQDHRAVDVLDLSFETRGGMRYRVASGPLESPFVSARNRLSVCSRRVAPPIGRV